MDCFMQFIRQLQVTYLATTSLISEFIKILGVALMGQKYYQVFVAATIMAANLDQLMVSVIVIIIGCLIVNLIIIILL